MKNNGKFTFTEFFIDLIIESYAQKLDSIVRLYTSKVYSIVILQKKINFIFTIIAYLKKIECFWQKKTFNIFPM